MALSPKNYRRLWFFLAVAYFSLGYLACNWLSNTRVHYYNLGFSFENKIPFIPYFILGYIVVYFCVVGLYFIIKDDLLFKKAIQAFFLLTTIHFVIFVLLPVKMTMRPAPPTETGLIYYLVRFYYWIDMPYNCFPSLHVSYTLLSALIIWDGKRIISYIYILAVIIVSISVILVKQHYIADVVGGYITASLIFWIVVSKRRSELKQ